MKKSNFFSLDWKDLFNAAWRAFFITFLTAALQVFQAGPVEWTWVFWQPTFIVGATALIGSLLKSLTTNSEGKVLTPEG